MALHLLPAPPRPARRPRRAAPAAAVLTRQGVRTVTPSQLAVLRRRVAVACLGSGFALATVAIAASVQALSWG